MTFIKYTVYVLIFACAVMFVQKQTAPRLEFHVGGSVKPGFEAVEETFRELIKTHMFGGAFAAYYKGEPVVDLWGGYADVDAQQFWEKDTISYAFSTTKGLAALCIGVLVTRGHMKYEDPVSKYWPEFAVNGKEKITVRTLLNHEAGLSSLDEPIKLQDIISDSPKVARSLAKQKPLWEPGSAHGYHAMTFGLYIDQIVRRVDPKRRNISKFFDDEIAKPLGADFSLCLKPADRHRDTRIIELSAMGLYDALWNAFETWDFRMIQCFYSISTDPNGLTAKSMLSVDGPASFNNVHKKMAEISSVNGHGTARALANIYGKIANDGAVVNGKPLIGDKALLEFLQVPDRLEMDKVIKVPVSYSGGMLHVPTPAGDFMFGTPGYGGQMGYADPKKQIGLGLLTNHLKIYVVHTDPRIWRLFNAVYSSVKKIEETRK